MILALILLVVGLIAGLARGGRIANIATVEIRWPALVFAGLGLQVGAELLAATILPQLSGGDAGLGVLAVSYFLLIVFLVINRRLAGSWFIGVGLALNFVVIVLNRGMPVSLAAVKAAGLERAGFLEAAVKHHAMGPETVLGFLGDVIPLPIVGSVVSLGDVVLGAGIFLLVSSLVRYHPKRSARVRSA